MTKPGLRLAVHSQLGAAPPTFTFTIKEAPLSAHNFHISQDGLLWKVTLNGVLMVRLGTQDQAYDYARRQAEVMGGGEISIHGRDGRVRAKNTIYPANDPRNIRG